MSHSGERQRQTDGAVRLIGSRSPMQKGVGAPRNLMPRLFTILTSRLNSGAAFGPAWSKISSWPACILRRDARQLLGTDCLTFSQHGHLGWRGRLNGRA